MTPTVWLRSNQFVVGCSRQRFGSSPVPVCPVPVCAFEGPRWFLKLVQKLAPGLYFVLSPGRSQKVPENIRRFPEGSCVRRFPEGSWNEGPRRFQKFVLDNVLSILFSTPASTLFEPILCWHIKSAIGLQKLR